MAEVRTKREFYELYDLGLFGNKALAWDSYDELIQSGFRGEVCIRGRGISRKEARYNIPLSRVRQEIESLIQKGYPEERLRFNQSMPDYALLIQGEVVRHVRHPPDYAGALELTYTTVQKPMNEALREEMKFAGGIVAQIILQEKLDESSFADLWVLLELYPDAVVEFSTYAVKVGDIPNRNTVFWEVRNY
ncbi:MAG: hypothetical protein PHH00_02755 [Candidatus Nanoarchaeia archaeon]|nr:hypothetical protein [Candidatus Nanoarchaeia archaeon]